MRIWQLIGGNTNCILRQSWLCIRKTKLTHIRVGKLSIIGSDNGLSAGRRQAIIWTNAGMLLIGPLGRNFSEILIWIQTFSFKKMHMQMSSAKWRPFCLGLNVLNHEEPTVHFLNCGTDRLVYYFSYQHACSDYKLQLPTKSIILIVNSSTNYRDIWNVYV